MFVSCFRLFTLPVLTRVTLFKDVAWATGRTEPPIVLAASPGLGAETMLLDVKRAADDDEHAVTTTTAVHARARNHAHTHTE